MTALLFAWGPRWPSYALKPWKLLTSRWHTTTVPQESTRPECKTLVWKQAGTLPIHADVFIPPNIKAGEKRPIAILFHGGGYMLYSRKRANPKQVTLLLSLGFLPVSFDYRLCPEMNVLDGPMNDACDALSWARSELPSLAPTLAPGLEADGGKVAAVGWSSGGHLSMTLGFTAAQRNIKPPEAILAFYCALDYHSEYWNIPVFPKGALSSPDEHYDVLSGFQKEPITSYFPSCPPGQYSLEDPHSRFILHMNWRGQTVPLLLRGPSYRPSDSTPPTDSEIDSISPYAHILGGDYRTPTFLIHGTRDEMIPLEHSIRAVETLKEKSIEAQIEIVDGAGHVFDAFPPPGLVFEPSVARGYT